MLLLLQQCLDLLGNYSLFFLLRLLLMQLLRLLIVNRWGRRVGLNRYLLRPTHLLLHHLPLLLFLLVLLNIATISKLLELSGLLLCVNSLPLGLDAY